jgi:hypothetical protein
VPIFGVPGGALVERAREDVPSRWALVRCRAGDGCFGSAIHVLLIAVTLAV